MLYPLYPTRSQWLPKRGHEAIKLISERLMIANLYVSRRDLTQWCLGMVRYLTNPEDKSATSVLLPWSYECCRLFRDKLATIEDKQKFDTILRNVLMADWNSNTFESLDTTFFVTPGNVSDT